METIKDLFKNKRPNLSENSLTTYYSLLKNLHNNIFESKIINMDNLKNSELILKYLDKKSQNTRNTILAALFVLTEIPEYGDEMTKQIIKIKAETEKQEQNDKQKENSITPLELDDIYKKLEKNTKMLYKLNNTEYLQDIQNFIIVSLYYLIPPRRLIDYTEFKIKSIGEGDNYMDGSKFVFNNYKTAKTYGQQIVKIPTILKNIIKKWIEINPTDYLLFDNKMNKLNSTTLIYKLNKIFGKKISVNALRHSYLSSKYNLTIKINKEIKKDMTDMGTSMMQSKTYIQNKE
jgi:DNA primase catalytic subunit